MFNFDKNYFKANKNKLIWLSNKWYARWLLGLNRLPKKIKNKKFNSITPNSVSCLNNGKTTIYFFTRPRFAEALAFNLSPFVYLKNNRQIEFQWKFSPVGVAAMIILAIVTKGTGFAFIGTTDYYGKNGGGSPRRTDSPSVAWATIRAANGDGLSTGTYNFIASLEADASGFLEIGRSVFPYDTSAIPDVATITNATAYFRGLAKNDVMSQSVNIGFGEMGDTDAVASSDYELNVAKVTCSSPITFAAFSAGYNAFVIDENKLTEISKVGDTVIVGRTQADFDNSAPSLPESELDAWLHSYFAENAGTTKDPYISVTYTTPTTSSSTTTTTTTSTSTTSTTTTTSSSTTTTTTSSSTSTSSSTTTTTTTTITTTSSSTSSTTTTTTTTSSSTTTTSSSTTTTTTTTTSTSSTTTSSSSSTSSTTTLPDNLRLAKEDGDYPIMAKKDETYKKVAKSDDYPIISKKDY